MNILVIGRGLPEVNTGMIGIFEFDQAKAIQKHKGYNLMYMFNDNRSILRLKKIHTYYDTIDNIKIYGKYLPIGGIPPYFFNKIKSKINLNLLKKIIQENGIPDIIHIHFPIITLTESTWEYLKSLKTKLVVTEHYSKVQNNELKYNEVLLLENIFKNVDTFICVNYKLGKSVQSITNIKRRFEVIPNLISKDFENNISKQKEKFIFSSIGRLVKEKQFDIVIKAFAEEFKNEEDVNLIVIGDGEEKENLQNLTKKLGVEEIVKFTGFLNREETAEMLSNSHVYVTGSSFETFGVPIIEALSSGLPVIIPNNSPLCDYINDNRGIIYTVNSAEELSIEMKRAYDNYAIYNNNEIANFAQKEFSEQAIVNKLTYIYKQNERVLN